MNTPDGLDLRILISLWNRDFRNDAVSGEPSFDLLLRRDIDRNVTFDNCLTSERVALLDIGRGEAQGTSAADSSFRHLHRATTATSLPAARLTDVNARKVRGIAQ